MSKELVELLLEGQVKEFKKRFQSFLDQIPGPLGAARAPGKEDFFRGYFLGMFSNLENTEIYGKLGIKDTNFKLDEKNNLHVIIKQKNNTQKVFVFANNTTADLLNAYQKEYGINACIVDICRDGGLKVEACGSGDSRRVVDDSFVKVPKVSMPNLEDCISGLSEVKSCRKSVNSFFKYCTNLYQKVRDSLIGGVDANMKGGLEGLFNTEAFQHGFLTGGLMNFRYRDNLKAHVELISGQGYADMLLLVRGEGRSTYAVPIIIELKKASYRGDILGKALDEAKWYAKGLYSNKMRVLTNSEKVICIGLDLNGAGHKHSVQDIKNPEAPFLQSLLGAVYENRGGIDKDEMEGVKAIRVSGILGEIYYSFPNTENAHNYLSNLFLGQSLILGEVKGHSVEQLSFFNYKCRDDQYLNTFLFLVGGKLLIFNINEREKPSTNYKFSIEQISDHFNITHDDVKQIIVVDVDAYTGQSDKTPGSYFCQKNVVHVKQYSIDDYGRSTRSVAGGTFYKINSDVGDIQERFSEAVSYQHKELKSLIGSGSLDLPRTPKGLGRYGKLFEQISEVLSNNRELLLKLVKKESHFKTVLDGILTGLSDVELNEENGLKVLVPTEFQVGGGGRVDIAIQTMDQDSGEHGVPVLVELKLKKPSGGSAVKTLIKKADEEVYDYTESPSVKMLTDGRVIVGFSAVLNLSAKEQEDMIEVSSKFIVSPVLHSSQSAVDSLGRVVSSSGSVSSIFSVASTEQSEVYSRRQGRH